MFLPHYDIYSVSITEKTMAKCYVLVLYNQKVRIFRQNSWVSLGYVAVNLSGGQPKMY